VVQRSILIWKCLLCNYLRIFSAGNDFINQNWSSPNFFFFFSWLLILCIYVYVIHCSLLCMIYVRMGFIAYWNKIKCLLSTVYYKKSGAVLLNLRQIYNFINIICWSNTILIVNFFKYKVNSAQFDYENMRIMSLKVWWNKT
jgi:hypothetical protein